MKACKSRIRTIPLDAEAVEVEGSRSYLQKEAPPRALQEPHAPLLYITCMSEPYRQEVEEGDDGRRTLLPKKRRSLLEWTSLCLFDSL